MGNPFTYCFCGISTDSLSTVICALPVPQHSLCVIQGMQYQDRVFQLSPSKSRHHLDVDYFQPGEEGDDSSASMEYKGTGRVLSAQPTGYNYHGGYGLELRMKRIGGGSTEPGEIQTMTLSADDPDEAIEWVRAFNRNNPMLFRSTDRSMSSLSQMSLSP